MNQLLKKYSFDAVDISNSRNGGAMSLRVTRTVSGYQIKVGKQLLAKLKVNSANYTKDLSQGGGLVIGTNKNSKELIIANDPSYENNRYKLSGSEDNPKIYSSYLGHKIESIIGKRISMNKTIAFADVEYDEDENNGDIVAIIKLTNCISSEGSFENEVEISNAALSVEDDDGGEE